MTIFAQVHLDDDDEETMLFSAMFEAVPRVGDELCYVFEAAQFGDLGTYSPEAIAQNKSIHRKHWIVTNIYHEIREYGLGEGQKSHLIFIYASEKDVER